MTLDRTTRQAAAPVSRLTGDELDLVVGGNIMQGLKLMGEMLSNVSKTRSEISMTFARNSRA